MSEGGSNPDQPSREGALKIQRWLDAIETYKRADRAKSSADCEVSNAANDLAKWLLPEDARVGEVFCVWSGDSLIQVEHRQNDDTVTIRKRGRHI